jgi:hypothetical protein
MRIRDRGHESPANVLASAPAASRSRLTRRVIHRPAATDFGIEATVCLAVALSGRDQFPQADDQLRFDAGLAREGDHDAHLLSPGLPSFHLAGVEDASIVPAPRRGARRCA